MFYDWKHHFQPFGRDGTVKIFYLMDDWMSESVNRLMNDEGVCQAAPAWLFPGLQNNVFMLKSPNYYIQSELWFLAQD